VVRDGTSKKKEEIIRGESKRAGTFSDREKYIKTHSKFFNRERDKDNHMNCPRENIVAGSGVDQGALNTTYRPLGAQEGRLVFEH